MHTAEDVEINAGDFKYRTREVLVTIASEFYSTDEI